MIINFSVQNFGCIKDKITLSFEATNSDELEDYYIVEPKKGLRLLKLGLIYGANASGKTTVLKSLDFLRNIVLNPLSKKTETFDFKPFLFDENTPTENTFFSLDFVHNEVKYLYEVELNEAAIIQEKLYFYRPNKALVFKRTTDVEKELTSIQFGSKLKINKENKAVLEGNTLWNNTVFGGYLKTNFEAHEIQEVIKWFENGLEKLIDSETDLLAYVSNKIKSNEINKNTVIKFLNKADFNITDIIIKRDKNGHLDELLERNPKVYLDKGLQKTVGEVYWEVSFRHLVKENSIENKYTLSYEDESQGTQRYYQFCGLLALMLENQVVLSIDELESALHPDLLAHFLLTFLVNTKKSQLIATTHQRELLMKKDMLRHDVIWFTEKRPDGSTDLFSAADFDSSVIRNTTSIYNAYKIGKLGATPNLSDYYIETADGKE